MSVRVGIVQIASGENKEENLEKAKRMVLQAADNDSKLVMLPEMFNYLPEVPNAEKYRRNAESLNGPTINSMIEIAFERNITIISGSIAENCQGRIYNTSCLIRPSRKVFTYRKVHLFKFGNINETAIFENGAEPLVTIGEGLKIGLTTCFDLRFPELYRTEALMGAQVITNVAAFLESTGRAHWMVLLRARAIENQVFILAANQAKSARRGATYYGNSAVIDPWGKILARAHQKEELLITDICPAKVDEVRNKMPAICARRPSVYKL